MQINPLRDDNSVISLTSQYAATGLQSCMQYGRLIQVAFELTPSTITHGDILIPKLPRTLVPCYMTVGMSNGQCVPCVLSNVVGQDYSNLTVYYPSAITPSRIDVTFSYIAL